MSSKQSEYLDRSLYMPKFLTLLIKIKHIIVEFDSYFLRLKMGITSKVFPERREYLFSNIMLKKALSEDCVFLEIGSSDGLEMSNAIEFTNGKLSGYLIEPSIENLEKSKKIDTKYHIEKQKDCGLFPYGLTFEFSHWKINGVPQHGNIGLLSSTKPFSYQFYVGTHGKFNRSMWYQVFWFGELEKSIDHSEITHNIDECLTFEFDYNAGKLIIETKNNIHFEFQFKFQNQAAIVDQFLKFINLRNYKISDKIIKEIKLKNNSKKIELRINKKDLHEHEEVLVSYSDPMTFPFEKGEPEVLIRDETQIITNLRIMGDVWYYPAFFVNPEVKEVGFGQLEEITNFTHDQYDEIFISKNPASSQGSVKFMSKGKPFWVLRNTPEPERLVELMKYAKSQFESQDKKIIEPIVSSSDNDPLKILKMRLAKGEITLEEFNEIKENLV